MTLLKRLFLAIEPDQANLEMCSEFTELNNNHPCQMGQQE